jgi:hypothetical protein
MQQGLISALSVNEVINLQTDGLERVSRGYPVDDLTFRRAVRLWKMFFGAENDRTKYPEPFDDVPSDCYIGPVEGFDDVPADLRQASDVRRRKLDDHFYSVFSIAKRRVLFVPKNRELVYPRGTEPEGEVTGRRTTDTHVFDPVPKGAIGFLSRNLRHYGLELHEYGIQLTDPPPDVRQAMESEVMAQYVARAAGVTANTFDMFLTKLGDKLSPNWLVAAMAYASAHGASLFAPATMGLRHEERDGGDTEPRGDRSQKRGRRGAES